MTPVAKIVDWVSSKPVWWRHAVRLALSKGRLTDEERDQIMEVARMEHGLSARSDLFEAWAEPLDITGYRQELHEVSLTSISGVKGVNALAEGQHLTFPPQGLVIIYGDNGSGKSSYTGILKNACLTRGECLPVRGNVFCTENPAPEAALTVLSNGAPAEYIWKPGDAGDAVLKSIRVFDTSSAAHYVNKEDTLRLNPAGLHLLTDLADAVSHIRRIVDEECQPGNGLHPLSLPLSEGAVSLFLRGLDETSDEAKLRGYAATDAESSRIAPLMREIALQQLNTPETVRHSLRQRERLLTSLLNVLEVPLRELNDDALPRVRVLHKDYITKRQLAENLKTASLSGMPFTTVGSQPWLLVWKSAREFIAAERVGAAFPMQNGDSCPLCLQTVTDEGAERLRMLDNYLADEASRAAQTAWDDYNAGITTLRNLRFSLKEHEASLHELEGSFPGSGDRIKALFDSLAERRRLLMEDMLPENLPEADYEIASLLLKQRDSLAAQAENLTTDADLTTLIQSKERELENLQERDFVKCHLDILLANLTRHRTLHKLRKLQSECATQSISRLSAQINQTDVVDPLIEAFEAELSALGFNRFTVKVDTRNRGGHQQFKLVIEQSGEPVVSKVASEGEQRCIALASFFAEMRAEGRRSAVVFDDPVNSLSHQWRAVIARRLVSESGHRQVIVFTHDLVFYKWLIEEAELRVKPHAELSLDRSRSAAGFVRTSPPWDALSTGKRIRKLRADLVQLRKQEREETLLQQDFLRAAGLFYGELRETWERLVEEKLLNAVVTRFERGVATRRLSRLTDITQADYDLVEEAMSKCSTYFTGHDSATAAGNPSPSTDEMEQDIGVIENYNHHLQKDRKRS